MSGSESRAVAILRQDLPTVRARAELAPRDTLPGRIAELKAGMAPAPERALKREIARLAASYPSAAPPSATGWLAGMIEEASGYPADVIEETVRRLRRACKWLPSIAEFLQVADETMGQRRAALYAAEAQLRRHAELDEEDARRREREAERQAGEARRQRLIALLNKLDFGFDDAEGWLSTLRWPLSHHVKWGHAAAEQDGMPEAELLELFRGVRDREEGAAARLEALHTTFCRD